MLPPSVRRAFRLAAPRRERTEADVDAEIAFHVEMRAAQLVARGWTPADAEREARQRFAPGTGEWERAVARLHGAGHSREDRLAMRDRLDALRHDVRYALRGLRRAPRYTITAVLTLALGLGATTVVFSLADHIALRPLPYRDAERLVVVREVIEDQIDLYPSLGANASHFVAWREACRACDAMAAVRTVSLTLTGGAEPERINALRATPNLFPVLGARVALGRTFTEAEDDPQGERVIVLSDAFWRNRLGADPGVLDSAITLGGMPHRVIGVLAPGFALPPGDGLGTMMGIPRDVAGYVPLALDQRERVTPGEFSYAAIARLRPGATPAQLQSELDVATTALLAAQGRDRVIRTTVVPLREQVVGSARAPLVLLLGAVGGVLLIVCANLANLALARNVARQRESALRVALGAGRARVARLALAESVALAVAGGAVGLLLARWGLDALVATAPESLPRLDAIALDARLVAISVALALVVGVAFGTLPALRVSRASPAEAMRGGGGRTATAGRAVARGRSIFIAAQVAVSTLLLVVTGLLLSSFVRVLGEDRGFDAERVLAVDVAASNRSALGPDGYRQLYTQILDEARGMPGVVAAAVTNAVPLGGEQQVDVLGRAEDVLDPATAATANIRWVTPGYFAAVGTPVTRGRAFTDADRERNVAIVSERAAESLWPGQNPIGRRIVPGSNDSIAEVVGVAADIRTSSLEEQGSLVVYLPKIRGGNATVLLRATGDPTALAGGARAVIRRVAPDAPITRVRTLEDVVSAAVAERRFQLLLLGIFALMAFVTASIGVYGVISHSLALRSGEMGVRMALGARPADVYRLVFREGLRPVAAGLVVGVLLSLAAGRLLGALLFDVRPGDPATIGAVVLLLGAVGVIACLVPARRAARAGTEAMLRLE